MHIIRITEVLHFVQLVKCLLLQNEWPVTLKSIPLKTGLTGPILAENGPSRPLLLLQKTFYKHVCMQQYCVV